MSRRVVEFHPVFNMHLFVHKFQNIDLPYRGYYQVRIQPSAETGAELEIRLDGKEKNDDLDTLFLLPSSICTGVAVSKTFEVIYADEEFKLNDGFLVSLRSTNMFPLQVTLSVELWYMDRNRPPRSEFFQMLSSRKVCVSLSLSSCISSSREVVFEYSFASSISLGVTASLVSLLPRRRRDPPDPPLGEELVKLYEEVFSYLFGSIRSLHELIRSVTNYLKIEIVQESLNGKEEEMKEAFVSSQSPWNTLEHDTVTLSSTLSSLFTQTIELSARNEGVLNHFLHLFCAWKRRRMAEAFFTTEGSSIGTFGLLPLTSLLALISSHPYMSSLPSHPLYSPQLDLSLSNMPFIFEELFLASSSHDPSPCLTPTAITPTSPLDIAQYSPRSLSKLADYAREKDSVKESVKTLLTKEFCLLSECCRSLRDVQSKAGSHLIVMVHGLEGAGDDLWSYRVQLKRLLPSNETYYLCSKINEGSTWGDVNSLGEALLLEMDRFIGTLGCSPTRISFIAHSLGGVIVRVAISLPGAEWVRSRAHTLLTLNSPHLGLSYTRTSSHVGLTLVQWYKRSRCLSQLSMRDTDTFSDSFLVKLSTSGSFCPFKNVLLVASSGDNMVPRHSALVSTCSSAVKDRSSLGAAFGHMLSCVQKELEGRTTVRYSVIHRKGGEKMRGRPAHTACVEDSLFIEKLLTSSVVQYFY